MKISSFGPIVKALKDKWTDDQIQRRKIEKILQMFKNNGKRLAYNGKLRITRKSVSDVLQLAHDCKISGQFNFAKTRSRLRNCH